MSNDIALDILKDLMTKLIDKFDEMPRRQEVADDLTTLATAVTAIATKMNTPPRHEELKEYTESVGTEVKSVKTDVAGITKLMNAVNSKINKFILIAGIVVALFFLVAIFTEVYTAIRPPAQTTAVVHDHKELVEKLDAIQKRMNELHPGVK